MKILVYIAFVYISISSLHQVHSANILVYVGFGSYSHRVPFQPLMDALTDNGHQVSYLCPFLPKPQHHNPKVHDVNPKKLIEWTANHIKSGFDVFEMRKNSKIMWSWITLTKFGLGTCESLYSDPEFLTWLKTAKFDLVIMDPLGNECVYGMVHLFKAKLMSFNTATLYPWNLESRYGLPDETSSIPDVMTHMPTDMNIFQRMVTALIPIVWKTLRECWYFPKLEEMTRKGLNMKDLPRFVDIEANNSLTLLNSHWAQEFPRSLPPNIIPVGGLAGLGKRKPLPKNIEEFINKGKDGFIYVSFGTIAEFTNFGPEIRQAFINTIGKFPNIQFIWKSTYPIQEKLPGNVLVEKWLPQVDILAHPNIKMFISHGGMGGIYEAILSKVPMVCFPAFAEQDYNADLIVRKGYGIKLELISLKEEELVGAIKNIMNDRSYKIQIEKVSKMFTDRPMNPLETAVWWVEFVLRHDTTLEFLRPLSATQSWWVRRQLDVWALVFTILLVILTLPILILWCVIKRLIRRVSRNAITKSKRKEKRS